jgi:hypothetical protein
MEIAYTKKMKKSAYLKPFLVGALFGAGWLLYSMFVSTSSTAPVGLILMPVLMMLGGLAGAAVAHLGLVLMGKKKLLSVESGVVMLLALLVCGKIYSDNKREVFFKNIETTSEREEIDLFLKTEDEVVAGTLASNVHLTELDLAQLIERWKFDYMIMSRVIVHAKLTVPMMATIVNNVPPGNPENSLFQTYVLAPLVRNKNLPDDLFHRIANLGVAEHFLALAIIESPRSTCDEIRPYATAKNAVLANTAYNAMVEKKCP